MSEILLQNAYLMMTAWTTFCTRFYASCAAINAKTQWCWTKKRRVAIQITETMTQTRMSLRRHELPCATMRRHGRARQRRAVGDMRWHGTGTPCRSAACHGMSWRQILECINIYISVSQEAFEFGFNLPSCRATAILKMVSSVTPVSVIPRTSSGQPENVCTSSALTVSLFFTGGFSRSYYFVGHFATNSLKRLARKSLRCLFVPMIGFMVVASIGSGPPARPRPILQLAQPSFPPTGRCS
jgi:hypothetical protein